jgi:hypothetical protein
MAHRSRTFLISSRSEKEYSSADETKSKRSQFSNWRGEMRKILSRSARLYTTYTRVLPSQNDCKHYLQLSPANATAFLVESLWRTWLIHMQRKWCKLRCVTSLRYFHLPKFVIPRSEATRNLLFAYTVTAA